MTARSLRIASISGVICALVALASCTQDGVTSNCPPLPLYETFALGDASPPDAGSADSAQTQAELAAAVKAGCATPATMGVVASSVGGGGGNAGSGGSAGKGGSSGAAGHPSGGTSAGGSTNTENAGAAGSN